MNKSNTHTIFCLSLNYYIFNSIVITLEKDEILSTIYSVHCTQINNKNMVCLAKSTHNFIFSVKFFLNL